MTEHELRAQIHTLHTTGEKREEKLQEDIRLLRKELADREGGRSAQGLGEQDESERLATDMQRYADEASMPQFESERWLSRYQMLESRAREAELQVVSLRVERDGLRQRLVDTEETCKTEHEQVCPPPHFQVPPTEKTF